MKSKIYTVHAYKWGDRGLHSYSVGVYSKKQRALDQAEDETQYRGGKYDCEVLEWVPDAENEDKSPGVPHKVIKALPKAKRLGQLGQDDGATW